MSNNDDYTTVCSFCGEEKGHRPDCACALHRDFDITTVMESQRETMTKQPKPYPILLALQYTLVTLKRTQKINGTTNLSRSILTMKLFDQYIRKYSMHYFIDALIGKGVFSSGQLIPPIPPDRFDRLEKVMDNTEEGGTKYDGEKVPVELVPLDPVYEIAKVLGFGKAKYASWNWYKGIGRTRLLAAALRHIWKYLRGHNNDSESGLCHLAHAGCCILFALQFHIEDREDDRVAFNAPVHGGIHNE